MRDEDMTEICKIIWSRNRINREQLYGWNTRTNRHYIYKIGKFKKNTAKHFFTQLVDQLLNFLLQDIMDANCAYMFKMVSS